MQAASASVMAEGGGATTPPPMERRIGTLPSGQEARAWTIRSATGTSVEIMNVGATILKLRTRDRKGELGDIVLGHADELRYLEDSNYFGGIVGRVANRIKEGMMTVGGVQYQLDCNNGANHLHGGSIGYDKRVWECKRIRNGLEFSLFSLDGEEGYPGEVHITARYTLQGNVLTLEMRARSSSMTPINLAQHSYFNLAGHASGSVLGHEVLVFADKYTPMVQQIPTGEVKAVEGSAYDLREPSCLGKKIAQLGKEKGMDIAYDEEKGVLLKDGAELAEEDEEAGPRCVAPIGFDDNFVVRRKEPNLLQRILSLGRERLHPVAKVVEKKSGRTMLIESNVPGVQFYTANFLCGVRGKEECVYLQHGGLCLETQHFPNSINVDSESEFGKGACRIIDEGEEYVHKVQYTFGTE
uniref:Aldose 1-epimerase n=1 Tax=Hanusia phi TaxID=3032 RepID=A0A7S0DYS4_9CRYP